MNRRVTLLGLSLVTALQLHAIENLMMTFKYGLTDLDGSLSLKKNTVGVDFTVDIASNIKPKFDFSYLSVDEGGNGVDYTLQFSANALYEGSEFYNNSWLPYFYGGIGYEYVHNNRPSFDSAPYVQIAGGIEFPFFGYRNEDYKIITEARWMQMFADGGGQTNEAAIFIGFRISTGALTSGYNRAAASYGYENSPDYVELEADDLPKNAPELTKENIVFSDTDGDGVADKDDKCPHTARGVIVDENGCAISSAVGSMKYSAQRGDFTRKREKKVTFPTLPKKRTVFSINFPPNTYTIPKEDRDKIRKYVKQLQRVGYRYITVEGYTDNSGTPSQNRMLSQKRAEAVKDLMVQYGIDSEKITAVGKGELNPIANNDVPEGRALNRRIEIVVE
jgi:outer membrane protein OmpA-like peptidoglycan-associated protein